MARRTFPAHLQPAAPSVPSSLFDAPPTLVISCDDCVMAGTDACADCLVPFLLGDEPATADTAGTTSATPTPAPRPESVALDAGEVVTLRLLQQAGLAPELRHPRHAPVLAVIGGRG